MNYEIPSTLLYSKGHVWARVQNGAAVVGVTDYLQRELGTVINVEFSDSEVVEREPHSLVGVRKGDNTSALSDRLRSNRV